MADSATPQLPAEPQHKAHRGSRPAYSEGGFRAGYLDVHPLVLERS